MKELKEKEKEETEETVKFIQVEPSTFKKQQIYSLSNIVKSFRINWLFLSDFAFDLKLLADLGIFENVEIFPDIRSSS